MAPFKFKFSRASKSNSSSRSNSTEAPDSSSHSCCDSELNSPSGAAGTASLAAGGIPAILEGGESETTSDDTGEAGMSAVPSSPPPSYEYVLEETRMQKSVTSPTKGPEILHKSSKELYKAVAKQFGITCKMSDQCRCFDCQSHYFECEYEENEQEKTDGGLGAGTPMFISEVMHGTACTIL